MAVRAWSAGRVMARTGEAWTGKAVEAWEAVAVRQGVAGQAWHGGSGPGPAGPG